MTYRTLFRWRFGIALALAIFLVFFTLISLGSAFRDNDQAALISGCIQLLRGQMSAFHSAFYNYDKQWGSYLLLTGLSAITPQLDPVLRGNVLQVSLLLPAMLLCILTLFRKKRVPIWTFLPLFLSPALVLYMPFLATASLSLAFLFLGFFLMRSGWKWTALLAIAAAAACRGDVVLVAPVMLLSSIPRQSFSSLLRSKFAWLTAIAAIAPVLLGKLITAIPFSDLAGFSFSLPLFAGFLTFGLGTGVVLLLVVVALAQLKLIFANQSWRLFYCLELFALLLPIGFYWAQLYSPRYFFLTLAALLFFCTSRRMAVRARRVPSAIPIAVITLAVLPWIVGVSLPSLRHIRPTLTNPTRFPTADGAFPMGAYGAFALLSATRDHLNIDHNQKTWLSARSVDFHTCNGFVPVMATPMSYYLDLVIRLQGKTPARIVDVTRSSVDQISCGGAYVDLRAIIRHDSPGMDVERTNMTIVSNDAGLGRPIVWLANDRAPSTQTESFRELEEYFHGKDAEVFVGQSHRPEIHAGVHTIYFSDSGACRSRIGGTRHLCAEPESTEDGYAQTIFPDYMNK